MKIFSLNVVVAVVMCLSGAMGGIFVGLSCSEKSFLDIIWVLQR